MYIGWLDEPNAENVFNNSICKGYTSYGGRATLSEVDAVRSLNATERVIAQNGSAAFGNLSRGAGA